MKKEFIRTSESVCEGHPDKVCDRISDAVLDACLTVDKDAKVACETMATKNTIIVAGEIRCKEVVNINEIATKTLEKIGYDSSKFSVYDLTQKQSDDIFYGVCNPIETRGEKTKEMGAGDQGTVFGYATNETEEFLPLPLVLSHKICKALDDCRKSNEIAYIKPDGKAQVSVVYNDGKPLYVDTVVVSIQHEDWVTQEQICKDVNNKILQKVVPGCLMSEKTRVLINPSGRFVIGGPAGDTGLTGRKIIVDTYGGHAHHGGGAFSGKDPSKVDRSAAYMARHIAKNVVASGFADKCEIALSYAIGVAKPVAILIETYGTNTVEIEKIRDYITSEFSLTPSGIINDLELLDTKYEGTAVYGHFKAPGKYKWEKIKSGVAI